METSINENISVIIPTYNRAQLLSLAIQSVLNQTYSNIEIIIVDDGSTDNTQEVVFSFNDKRIKYKKLNGPSGISNARNSGLHIAEGNYICFIDDDDEYHPQKIELQLNKFKSSSNSAVGVVYSWYKYVSNGKTIKINTPSHKGSIFDKLLVSCFIHTSTVLVKTECFKRVGEFDPDFPSAEDWDMWLRISKHFDFDCIPEILSNYNIHQQTQISQDLENKILGREYFLAKYQQELKNNRLASNKIYRHLGALYAISNRRQKAKKYLLKSIQCWPFEIRSYVYLFFLFCDLFFKTKTIEYYASLNIASKKVY